MVSLPHALPALAVTVQPAVELPMLALVGENVNPVVPVTLPTALNVTAAQVEFAQLEAPSETGLLERLLTVAVTVVFWFAPSVTVEGAGDIATLPALFIVRVPEAAA